jgi:hypothetical protein
VSYSKACEEARKKGVIVNTIYCGDKAQGIREHWNLGGECGQGSFTNIDQNAKVVEIPTPFDTTLYVLNNKLNSTYIGYGHAGALNKTRQEAVDAENYSMNVSAAAKRTSVKGNKKLYDNSTWDLVDAVEKDKTIIEKMDMALLTDTLKNKSRNELKRIVEVKSAERSLIQQQIASVNTQRNNYIATEKLKKANTANEKTLETEVERIIKSQARRFNMTIE